MASSTCPQFLHLPRWRANYPPFSSTNFLQLQDFRFPRKLSLLVAARKKASDSLAQEGLNLNEEIVEDKKPAKRGAPRKSRKKVETESQDLSQVSEIINDADSEPVEEESRKPRKTRTKAKSTSSGLTEEKVEKKVTRRRRINKNSDEQKEEEEVGKEEERKEEVSWLEQSVDGEDDLFVLSDGEESDDQDDLNLDKDDDDDISSTYEWPPLVCCFGSAQHAFIPSGRPANRLVNYEIQDRMADAVWIPEKFVRAPGGSASNVALALASLGGRVAFMGSLGDDDYGQSILYLLNISNVQTRSVRIDSGTETAITHMKIAKKVGGGLRSTSVKPSAEDSLSKSDINIDVLREATMFYFNTLPILDRKMRSTTMKAIKIAKKLGELVFYDVNLPMPLWRSAEEAKSFTRKVSVLADIIEVSKQELEFLCGIKTEEKFDTRDNDSSKFVHYPPELIEPIWHENLKVLFVTNGTSKIHYYTKEHNGSFRGMEEAPISSFNSEMSASGDGIVAGLMRMLSVQPHLINDKGYLEQTVKYAINCGVIDQWLETRKRGYPIKEGMDEVPDENGLMSITEREYRTPVRVS
ncbi:fructokinase-like 2, chloroplastic [Impatiens glandulifera]|uniref:fructokinase-like 2, chloroplastic n=1 Tax=Impatiens glandulifera TaxID=253017 RepID=UPI001FB06BD2|nr:fructokinase-like 2, chloroplastic [Impatiens glandulifera]